MPVSEPSQSDGVRQAAATPIRVGPHGCLELLASRGAWLPSLRTMFVADVHLGKATAFAASGLPLSPEIGLRAAEADLVRLSALLNATSAARLVILGDFLHARASRQPDLLNMIAAWRQAHQSLAVTLIIGNHDRQVGTLPAELGIDEQPEGIVDGPAREAGINLVLRHEPTTDPRGYVLCGHIHPVVTLTAPAGGGCLRERLPIFVAGTDRLILPAFGSFTGGVTPPLLANDLLFALGGSSVILQLPPNAIGRRAAPARR